MSTDFDFARALEALCDRCERREKVDGYSFCTNCYQQTRSICAICRSRIPIGETYCDECEEDEEDEEESFAPSENASYEELLMWEQSRMEKYQHVDHSLPHMFPRHKITSKEMSILQTNKTTDCAICLEPFTTNDDVLTLPCLHLYHFECVSKWLPTNSNCPVCKCNVRDHV